MSSAGAFVMRASVPGRRQFRPLHLNCLLLLLTLIWGGNFSVVKFVLSEIPPHGFNVLRLVIASGLFLVVMKMTNVGLPRRSDLLGLLGLALTGHVFYQLCFVSGLARTSASNSALIIGSGPIAVTLLAVAVGQERVTFWHWAGTILSLGGVCLIVGLPETTEGGTLVGDLLTVCAVLFWTLYTVGGRVLLAYLSPMAVTGYSFILGTLIYVPFGVADLVRLDWSSVSIAAWFAVAYSGVFALFVSYLIWSIGVQQIGGAKTSVYVNMVPVVTIVVSTFWLGEVIGLWKVIGAVGVLGGVSLSKVGTTNSSMLLEDDSVN